MHTKVIVIGTNSKVLATKHCYSKDEEEKWIAHYMEQFPTHFIEVHEVIFDKDVMGMWVSKKTLQARRIDN